ncbi:MAG: acyl-CoA thioesterase [Chitinophagaceae bacterium]
MSRTRLQLPDAFAFTCTIPVRITDINYGGHAGNDTILSLIHEARMQYLRDLGFTELEFAGTGMIMTDVTIEFKAEVFYGDVILARVVCGECSRAGFELFYKLQKGPDDRLQDVAYARTGMICYDYDNKKVVSIPEKARQKLRP